VLNIKQSIFSAAVLRRNLTEKAEMPSARTATLKMDWAEPFHESCPMGIEWSAELWTKGNWSVEDHGLAVDMR
jgi:hypothetical protein